MKNHLLGLFLMVIVLFACHPKTLQPSDASALKDGIYLITKTQEKRPNPSALKKGEMIIKYNYRFSDTTQQKDNYLVLVKEEYVPLTLKAKPIAIEQEDKRKKLNLELNQNAKERMADFTRKHLNKRIAMVIKGEAVTLHVIRSVIDGGFLQITRCTDNACEFLYGELQDNVVQ